MPLHENPIHTPVNPGAGGDGGTGLKGTRGPDSYSQGP